MRLTQGKPSELRAFLDLDESYRAKLLSYAAWRREMMGDAIESMGEAAGLLLPVLEMLRLTEVW